MCKNDRDINFQDVCSKGVNIYSIKKSLVFSLTFFSFFFYNETILHFISVMYLSQEIVEDLDTWGLLTNPNCKVVSKKNEATVNMPQTQQAKVKKKY